MNMEEYRRRRRREQKHHNVQTILTVLIGILIILALILGVAAAIKYKNNKTGAVDTSITVPSADAAPPITTVAAETEGENLTALFSQAKLLADGYDYDGAISLLQADTQYQSTQEVLDAISDYETAKSALVSINPQEVTHVFFHSLIADTAKAFKGDKKEAGYNQMMTTKTEFISMMQSMYDKGYVLIKIHDLAYETTDENGKPKFVYGDVKLPEGKKAFILSQDDVCYYEYMKDDGFASRIIIGEDGYPTCEMDQPDGSVSVGDYDIVPVLETFIREHPGFSYKGARGILAFTGYNGILGYRTDESYKDTNPNYEADRETASKVAQNLRDHGWELASHSWGHRNMGTISMAHFTTDCDKWEKNVESLIGPTDIILYPFGSDIETWKPYKEDNERFLYLKSLGFRYFCNVDASKPYWTQMGQDHIRQGRRNLDGYRMYYYPDSLKDLFDTSQVFDPARPTPVAPM